MAFPNDGVKFQKGKSGNPAGMKKGTRHASTMLKLALEKGVEVEVNKKKVTVDFAKLIEKVCVGIAKGNTKMIELVFDRIDGKASQPIEHSGSIDSNELDGLTVAELIELRKQLTGKKK